MSEFSTAEKAVHYGSGFVVTAGLLVGGIQGTRMWADDELAFARSDIAEHTEVYEEQVDESLHNLVRLEANLGARCVTLVRPYLSNRTLADASEDSAVTDIFDSGNTACGSSPTSIRESVVQLRLADSAVNGEVAHEREEEFNQLINKAETTKVDNAAAKWIFGTAGSFGLALALGYMTYRTSREISVRRHAKDHTKRRA